MNKLNNRPVVLCILDGWGYSSNTENNAIAMANTPVWDSFIKNCPNSLLGTSGTDVGLPAGQMGNSEVGHTNIGSGRIVKQALPMIDQSIEKGLLENNHTLKSFISDLKGGTGRCHIMAMISDGGVHSHMNHVLALSKIIAKQDIDVEIHAFLDGRDTPPRKAKEFITQFQKEIEGSRGINIPTISGRYYAMDRDKRWDRTELAYNALVSAQGEREETAEKTVENSYANDITDEFIRPTIIGNYSGMADNDGILMVNFRADRVRQILAALLDPNFDGFNRKSVVSFKAAMGMMEYSEKLNQFMGTLFSAEKLENVLGQIISQNNLKQFRIAETEKYAHVTFFFYTKATKLSFGLNLHFQKSFLIKIARMRVQSS